MRHKIRNKREIIEKTRERRTVVKYARIASSDAKRSSRALAISYDIIKNGAVYKVLGGNEIKVADLKKTEIKDTKITKGSVICLK